MSLVLEIGKSRSVEIQLPKKVLITGDLRADALNIPGIAELVDV